MIWRHLRRDLKSVKEGDMHIFEVDCCRLENNNEKSLRREVFGETAKRSVWLLKRKQGKNLL